MPACPFLVVVAFELVGFLRSMKAQVEVSVRWIPFLLMQGVLFFLFCLLMRHLPLIVSRLERGWLSDLPCWLSE